MPPSNTIAHKGGPAAALLGLSTATDSPGQSQRFFFESPLISRQVAVLKQLVESSSRVIVVMGERGSGKSTLIQRIVSETPGKWKPGRLILSFRNQRQTARKSALDRRAVFFTGHGTAPTVILDDAHQLTLNDLKRLIHRTLPKGGDHKFKTVILFAESRLRGSLKSIARWLPPETVIEKIQISPFTEQQTAAYLTHRLKAAALLDRLPFSKQQLKTIHSLSGGLPGWINGEAYMLLKKMKQRRIKKNRLNRTFGLLPAAFKSAG
jgi:type II secretory pathway predicted ATPase ExeA